MQNRWEDSSALRAPIADVGAWCRAQSRASLLWRGALWLYFFVAGVRLVWHPATGDLFGLITFGIHEIGHVIFGFLGQFFGIAGGSIAQILAPLYAFFLFWRQRDYFALGIGGYWFASSLFNLSIYIGDARAQELELVSPFAFGEEPIHDWNYLLSTLHLLPFDGVLSWLTRLLATLIFCVALSWSAWMMWRIAKQ